MPFSAKCAQTQTGRQGAFLWFPRSRKEGGRWEEWPSGREKRWEGSGGKEEKTVRDSLLSFLAPMDTVKEHCRPLWGGLVVGKLPSVSKHMLEMWPLQEGLVPMAGGSGIPCPGHRRKDRAFKCSQHSPQQPSQSPSPLFTQARMFNEDNKSIKADLSCHS